VASPDIVVPTLDTVRHESLLYTWLAEHKPMGQYWYTLFCRCIPITVLLFPYIFFNVLSTALDPARVRASAPARVCCSCSWICSCSMLLPCSCCPAPSHILASFLISLALSSAPFHMLLYSKPFWRVFTRPFCSLDTFNLYLTYVLPMAVAPFFYCIFTLYHWILCSVLCGPPGSGKTMTLFSALRSLPDMEVRFRPELC